jgi:hypothetical protein
VRTLLALALLLPVAGCSDRRAEGPAQSASKSKVAGADNIALRIPRSGGIVRAFPLGNVDSAVWSSSQAAAPPARLIGFDSDAGSLSYVDSKGLPRRIDLRLGGVGAAASASARLASFSSADGAAIFALGESGTVVRLAASGEAWSYSPPGGATSVFPQGDGTIVVAAREDGATKLRRLMPPADRVLDSVVVPVADPRLKVQAGDRLYFSADTALVGVRSRTLEIVPPIALDAPPRALASTPSGDRIFIVQEGLTELAIADRYRSVVNGSVKLPGPARDMRMDPLGRYLLVRPQGGDSAWVVALGTSKVIGSVVTAWRADLPDIAPDGTLLVIKDNDVVLLDTESLETKRRVEGGARDFWAIIAWNGFRPRPPGLDEPVVFARADSGDTASMGDSMPGDSTADHDAPAPVVEPQQRPQPRGYLVSFASFPSESRAREVAEEISVNGVRPRVVAAPLGVATVYRVILGPYSSRAEAERIGRESGRTFWVFEANQ